MQAIVYTEYGPPGVLHLRDIEKPVPGDDEVLIKVRAAEATKADCEMRSCHFAAAWLALPMRMALGFKKPKRPVPGMYLSGEIDDAGRNVSNLRKGDRVFGSSGLRLGAYGEYVCLPARCTIVPAPATVSLEEAAAVPLGGMNALHFMRRAKIRSGEKVLINGAGGSIGVFAVQIAKAMGAEVTAVDSGLKEHLLRSIGADHFIDYAAEDFTKSGKSYDVIFSMVARSSYSGCVKALNPGGRYVLANPRISDMLRSILTSAFRGKKAIFAFAGETEEELLALRRMIEDGIIRPVVDSVYPMERAAEAHQRVEAEQRLGAVVISIGKRNER